MQGMWVQSLARELRSHQPRGQKTETEKRNNTVMNSIKTLKMVYIKKKIHHFKECDSVTLRIFPRVCDHHHCLILEYVITPKEIL